jgi:hypothetical protein
MPEPVYVHVRDMRDGWAATNRYASRWEIENRTAVWSSPDKVSVTRSTLTQGYTRDRAKTWARWKTDSVYGLRRLPNGTIVPYHRIWMPPRDNHGGHWRNTVPDAAFRQLDAGTGSLGAEVTDHYATEVKKNLGIEKLTDLYPMAEHYGIHTYHQMPYGMRHAMRQPEIRPFVEELFGKSRYRRDLLKVVRDTENLSVIELVRQFKGFVPVDWMVNFIRENPHAMRERELGWVSININIRRFLPFIDPRAYRSLLRRSFDQNDSYMVMDMSRWPGVAAIDNREPPRTWRAFHDVIAGGEMLPGNPRMRQRPPRRGGRRVYVDNVYAPIPDTDAEIKLTETAEKLHGLNIGPIAIECATTTFQMKEWGNEMHNCIGGYRQTAYEGRGVYGVVWAGGKIIGAFEVNRNGDLVQLLGKYNKTMPDQPRSLTVQALESAGVNTSGNWWGRDADGLAVF